jgi:predicted RNA-binding protein YlxR (DUF448 family)
VAAREYTYRIQCQFSGLKVVDRHITVFVGTPTLAQQKSKRGAWLVAESKAAADEVAERLLGRAQVACEKGKPETFLAEMDQFKGWETQPDAGD